MSRLTRDAMAEPFSREQFFRRERSDLSRHPNGRMMEGNPTCYCSDESTLSCTEELNSSISKCSVSSDSQNGSRRGLMECLVTWQRFSTEHWHSTSHVLPIRVEATTRGPVVTSSRWLFYLNLYLHLYRKYCGDFKLAAISRATRTFDIYLSLVLLARVLLCCWNSSYLYTLNEASANDPTHICVTSSSSCSPVMAG